MWDPAQYLRFGDERSRPFFELTARIQAQAPGQVTDLGCGPGQLTAALAERWPAAQVRGVDSDPEMVAAAQSLAVPDRVSFARGDLRDWRPGHPVDVIVANAVLQWVPGHADLLPGWVDALAPGGWLAFQVPGNLDQPMHTILRELARSRSWRSRLGDVALNRQAGDPADYARLLLAAGCRVDAWETTYLHVLPGPDPVLEWARGTALRPVLAALDPAGAAQFGQEYGGLVAKAYPAAAYGTILPFRRVFVVAQAPGPDIPR
jgi:trans-aconitate 2-methyltransferase